MRTSRWDIESDEFFKILPPLLSQIHVIWAELILEPSHVISDFANVPDVGKEREREASSGYRRLDSNLPNFIWDLQ